MVPISATVTSGDFWSTSVSFGIYWCGAHWFAVDQRMTETCWYASTHVSTKQMTWTCESNGVSLLFLSGAFSLHQSLGHIGLCTQISSPPLPLVCSLHSYLRDLRTGQRCVLWPVKCRQKWQSASSGTWRGTADFCVLFWILYSFFTVRQCFIEQEKCNRPGIKP